MTPSIAERYRNSMRRHHFGYALYEPPPFSRLHPGMLGYLDDYKRWHPILDVTDKAAVQAAGYSPIGYLQRAPADVRRHGPLTASDVAATEIALEAGIGAAALGLPLGVNGAVRYSITDGFGAVLMCDGDVVSEGFDFQDPFLVWLKRNAKVLFAKYPDAKKNGICAVTWTYSATDIHINTWEDAANSVMLGFEADMMGAGKLGPQTTWFRGHASSGWSEWTDQNRVIFFTGVQIKSSFLGATQQPEKGWRGEETFMVEGEDGDYHKAEVEVVTD